MSQLNFNVKAAQGSGRPRAYNPRGKVAVSDPWPISMLLLIGAVMITAFTLVWII